MHPWEISDKGALVQGLKWGPFSTNTHQSRFPPCSYPQGRRGAEVLVICEGLRRVAIGLGALRFKTNSLVCEFFVRE